jgi:hypothetical protein
MRTPEPARRSARLRAISARDGHRRASGARRSREHRWPWRWRDQRPASRAGRSSLRARCHVPCGPSSAGGLRAVDEALVPSKQWRRSRSETRRPIPTSGPALDRHGTRQLLCPHAQRQDRLTRLSRALHSATSKILLAVPSRTRTPLARIEPLRGQSILEVLRTRPLTAPAPGSDRRLSGEAHQVGGHSQRSDHELQRSVPGLQRWRLGAR